MHRIARKKTSSENISMPRFSVVCSWSGGRVSDSCKSQLRGCVVLLSPGPLQATLSKLLTYCVLRLTQPPTLSGTENES